MVDVHNPVSNRARLIEMSYADSPASMGKPCATSSALCLGAKLARQLVSGRSRHERIGRQAAPLSPLAKALPDEARKASAFWIEMIPGLDDFCARCAFDFAIGQ
jgi:hypothetical protein